MRSLKLCILSCMFLLPIFAWAQEDGGGNDEGLRWKQRQERMEAMIQEVYNQLDLSDDQRAKLEQAKAKHESSRQEILTRLRANMKAMTEELKKTDYDQEKIRGLNEESKTLRDQMSDERLEGIFEVREILTPEQFARFSELMEKNKKSSHY